MLPCLIRQLKAQIAEACAPDPEASRVEEGCLRWCRHKHRGERVDRGCHVTLDAWHVAPKIRRARTKWTDQPAK